MLSGFDVCVLKVLCHLVEAILFDGFNELAIVFPVRKLVVGRSGSLQSLVLVLHIEIQRFNDESHGFG
jgi:hypothetical protein